MNYLLLIFIAVDAAQCLYIRRLKKEIAFRDGKEAKDNEPVIRRKRKENRAVSYTHLTLPTILRV